VARFGFGERPSAAARRASEIFTIFADETAGRDGRRNGAGLTGKIVAGSGRPPALTGRRFLS